MRSNSAKASRSALQYLTHTLVGLLAMGAIGLLRAELVPRFTRLKVTSDEYWLPSDDVTLVASLGYRSALADFIFGHVLVSHGLHFQEKRLFEHVGDYISAINRLDPKFADPYRLADTLLTLQPQVPPVEFYRRAREIQERGLTELPYDQQLWTTAGQYMAYLAPSRLKDPAEQDEYRRAGARALMHACNLIGSNENLPFHCITAANLLTADGQREAARSFLERVLAMTENAELRQLALRNLQRIQGGEEARARAMAREQRFREKLLHDGALFMSRIEIDALGPGSDTSQCAGTDAIANASCATSWRRWQELANPTPPEASAP